MVRMRRLDLRRKHIVNRSRKHGQMTQCIKAEGDKAARRGWVAWQSGVRRLSWLLPRMVEVGNGAAGGHDEVSTGHNFRLFRTPVVPLPSFVFRFCRCGFMIKSILALLRSRRDTTSQVSNFLHPSFVSPFSTSSPVRAIEINTLSAASFSPILVPHFRESYAYWETRKAGFDPRRSHTF